MSLNRRFRQVAAAGISFQAGSALVDSATIMSALIFQLTGSSVWVGAVTAILRFGWLAPHLFVGFLARGGGSAMAYYRLGAFGRATCMAALALALWLGANWPAAQLAILVMLIWTAYAFVSGIVAVPYNDLVARAIPSELRSRLLATRFFAGGLLALGLVAIADQFITAVTFPLSYAGIVAMAAALMFASSLIFVSMQEPPAPKTKAAGEQNQATNFWQYLRAGIGVFRSHRRFRYFVFAQWCGGGVLMAMPFYVVEAAGSGFDLAAVALLLAAQTTGALTSNLLWGWWGDKLGKGSLLQAIALGRIFPPAAIVLLGQFSNADPGQTLIFFILLFFILGALANGLTIAVIGFLMEISPDDQRPAYSGYFNAIIAPAFLLPLLAGIIASFLGLAVVFSISMLAAMGQFVIIRRLRSEATKKT